MGKLAEAEIEKKLAGFSDWSLIGDSLQRTFNFESFTDAIAFVGKVAKLAERHQHHPDILIRYSKVTLTLSTHDAGGLTEKDFDMAKHLDKLAA
jgi:4a-hydroxytetrahydrobiopterin dehydratase